jgi:hypothetical protein
MAKKHLPTVSKAKTILEEGEARGHKLSKKQKGFFGLIAGGGTPSKSKGAKGSTRRQGSSLKGSDETRRPIGDTGDYKVKRRGL